ncbi:twin-arginine translocase TatA/TatE family subunit [Georgenia sp. Z1491]|uniref:twin-arginine translocase TatA/TatE family subunit n=1 Tax=Georgenia sp. Z1491 TaxID=3416707 RepID=UPI003CF0D457
MFRNGLQPMHILVLVVVILLVFGASRLPDIASSIGKSLKVFKKEVRELREDDDAPSGRADQDPGAHGGTGDGGIDDRGRAPGGEGDGGRSPRGGAPDPRPAGSDDDRAPDDHASSRPPSTHAPGRQQPPSGSAG